ncbi:hypothetical protein BH11GEM2_BH11GEM2_01920 [soil metagenome]
MLCRYEAGAAGKPLISSDKAELRDYSKGRSLLPQTPIA